MTAMVVGGNVQIVMVLEQTALLVLVVEYVTVLIAKNLMVP